MLISLQAIATHLPSTVESLSHVELSRHLHCKLDSVVWSRGRKALCISCVHGQQVVFETRQTPVVTQ